MPSFDIVSRHRCFGGEVLFAKHASDVNACEMRFSVYLPPQAAHGPVPILYYLAGLTCTEETFMIKAGAQRVAADLGLMLVAPDTSPRGLGLPGKPPSPLKQGSIAVRAILPGQQRVARRPAGRRLHVMPVEDPPLPGDAVDVGRADVVLAEAAQFRPQIVNTDQHDVRLFLGG